MLVQKNSTAAELADFLRRAGNLPAVAESDLHHRHGQPADQRAAGDAPCGGASRRQGGVGPCGHDASARGCCTPRVVVSPDALTARLLNEIHSGGFERTVARWLGRLELALAAADDFSRERGRQLVDAARLFDETGSREVAEFVQFMERHTVRDADAAAVVRVLTVHKAKGLGFDLVILPDLEGTKLATRRRGLAVQRATAALNGFSICRRRPFMGKTMCWPPTWLQRKRMPVMRNWRYYMWP